MNIGEIAEVFIRAAEVDRSNHEHVGPAQPRSLPLPYVHDFRDKAGWGRAPGDFLAKGDDPLTEERRLFWERLGAMPTAHEIAQLEIVFDWLRSTGQDEERRALLAWARAKAGGKSFRKWCFKVEGVHPETGRKRKNRALAKIQALLGSSASQHDESDGTDRLSVGHGIEDVSATLATDAGDREDGNNWLARDAVSVMGGEDDFSWAAKRNEMRRQREARKRKEEAKRAA